MKVLQGCNLKSKIFALTVFVLAVVGASVSFAAQASSTTTPIKSKAVQGIESMCVSAADSIARNPEAEDKILGVLRDGFANIKKRNDGGSGTPEAIGVIRGAAITGIGRQPSGEGKLTSLVEECELALDRLGPFGFAF